MLSTNIITIMKKNAPDYSKLQWRSKRKSLTCRHIDLKRTSVKEIYRNQVLRGRELDLLCFICSYISELNQVWIEVSPHTWYAEIFFFCTISHSENAIHARKLRCTIFLFYHQSCCIKLEENGSLPAIESQSRLGRLLEDERKARNTRVSLNCCYMWHFISIQTCKQGSESKIKTEFYLKSKRHTQYRTHCSVAAAINGYERYCVQFPWEISFSNFNRPSIIKLYSLMYKWTPSILFADTMVI